MPLDNLTAQDDRQLRDLFEAGITALEQTLDGVTVVHEPQTTEGLQISLLMAVTERRILEASPQNRARFIGMLNYVANRLALSEVPTGQPH